MQGGCKKCEDANSRGMPLLADGQLVLLQVLLVKANRKKQQQHEENTSVSKPQIDCNIHFDS